MAATGSAKPQMARAHQAAPEHAPRGRTPIPLTALASVRVVEGPAMIRSENSRLMNYVTLNVRGRDSVGFVEEAKRAVAEKVSLPHGVHLEWSGQFEHQVRAARTLRFVWPAVFVLIFVILYLTYKDLADAALMMQLGCDGVFVGSGIFKSGDPARRATAIVEAVTHFNDPIRIAKVSENLGDAMVGINLDTLRQDELLAVRGW